jgi:hypothetical protein
LADAFVGDLLHAYAAWRADNGLAPTGPAMPAPPPLVALPSAADAGTEAPKAKTHKRHHVHRD